MSEAQRKVLDVFILFRKIKNKKRIYSDRCIEWTMRDLRSYLGKHYQYATPNQLERLLLQMNIIKEEKGNIADAGSKPSARRFIKFDSAFLEVYVLCKSANCWSGVPQAIPAKGFKKRGEDDECTTPFPDADKLYSLDGKQVLYADVLSTVSRGMVRLKAYFQKYHVEGDVSNIARSQMEEGVTLSKPRINDDGLQLEIEFGLTLNVHKMNKDRQLYTRARVEIELNRINEKLIDCDLDEVWPYNDNGMILRPSRTKKSHIVEALVQARKSLKKYMSDEGEQDWEDFATADITERYEGTLETPKTIIAKELEYTFFTFEGHTHVVKRFKVRGLLLNVSL